jgi:hypothetical protein
MEKTSHSVSGNGSDFQLWPLYVWYSATPRLEGKANDVLMFFMHTAMAVHYANFVRTLGPPCVSTVVLFHH